MRLFDTHCHLGLDGADPVAEHARAVAAGVHGMLVVGIDAATSARARELGALPHVRWSAGLHPNDATGLDAEWPAIEALARSPGCAAIGETGMDCYRDRCPLEQQLRSLHQHLALAHELQLPVILHCRDAWPHLHTALRGWVAAHGTPLRGVMHCFSGGPQEADEAVALGLHLSFAGPVTYPKNALLREAAARAPADRLLVETDSPFLPPQAFRGKRNEPALVCHALTAVAAARGMPVADAAELTFNNATALFGTPQR
ncbi:MAG: hypothetical protein RL148_1080 [Planctomycetota bacterium]|jgi:TatD DNase family protein